MPRRRPIKHQKRKKGPHRRQKKGKKFTRLTTTIVRQPGVVVADRTFLKMEYTDTTSTLLGAAGATFGYIRYQMNNAFDPNPLILTASVAGFNEMAALYERYRVRGCAIQLNCCNQMDFPVNVLVWPTTDDQSTVITQAYLQAMLSNAFCRYRCLSAKGGMDRCTIKNYISVKKLVGSNYPKYDDSFQALTSTGPTKPVFWNIGSYSLAGPVYTAGSIPFECRLVLYIEFFDRRQLVQ